VADGSFIGHLGQAEDGVNKPWDVLEQSDGGFVVANSGTHSVMCVVAALQLFALRPCPHPSARMP
jgi:hypothetical protein